MKPSTLLSILALIWITHRCYGLNIALHAQVAPTNDRIVGSVITTDGLKAAFLSRKAGNSYSVLQDDRVSKISTEQSPLDINVVQTFYPFTYLGFHDTLWDLVIIEGWFLGIHEFVQLARAHAPSVVILFYCLDPIFPGLEVVKTFDVDGFLTNSKRMVKILTHNTHKPTQLLLLAADEEVMHPHNSETSNRMERKGAVYVGAGGPMIAQKPMLVDLLYGAATAENIDDEIPLLLYGAKWGLSDLLAEYNATSHTRQKLETVSKAWKGLLPREQLQEAYANASVVLCSTMRDQSEWGMINNRVFEALACGAVVICEDSQQQHQPVPAGDVIDHTTTNHRQVLEEFVGPSPLTIPQQQQEPLLTHFLLFANSSDNVRVLLKALSQNRSHTKLLQAHARDFITHSHTYKYRIVKLLAFYDQLVMRRYFSQIRATISNINDSNSENWMSAAGFVSHRNKVAGALDTEPEPTSPGSERGATFTHTFNMNRQSSLPHAIIISSASTTTSSSDYEYLFAHNIHHLSRHFVLHWFSFEGFMDTATDINTETRSDQNSDPFASCYPHTQTICLSNAALSWLQGFGLCIGIGLPYDTIYQFLEELPALKVKGTDRIQKRIFISVAVNTSLFPTHSQTHTRISSHIDRADELMEICSRYTSVGQRSRNCVCDFQTLTRHCCEYSPSKYNDWATYTPTASTDNTTEHDDSRNSFGVCGLTVPFDEMVFRTHFEADLFHSHGPLIGFDRTLRTVIIDALPQILFAHVQTVQQNSGASTTTPTPSLPKNYYHVLMCSYAAMAVCAEGAQYSIPLAPTGSGSLDSDHELATLDAEASSTLTVLQWTEMFKNGTSTQAQAHPFRIILIGGLWEDWCSERWLVSTHTLPFITHVAGTDKHTLLSSMAVNVIAHASGVIYAHPHPLAVEAEMESSSTQQAASHTGTETVWPIVLARKLNIPIHFVMYHELLVHTAYHTPTLASATSTQTPNIEKLLVELERESHTLMNSLLFRLSSFASVRSSVALTQVCTHSELYNRLKSLSDSAPSSQSSHAPAPLGPLIVQVFTHEFRIGVDGQMCVYNADDVLSVCYIGPTVTLRLEITLRNATQATLSSEDIGTNAELTATLCSDAIIQYQSTLLQQSRLVAHTHVDLVIRGGGVFVNELSRTREHICVWSSMDVKPLLQHKSACLSTVVSEYAEMAPYALSVVV